MKTRERDCYQAAGSNAHLQAWADNAFTSLGDDGPESLRSTYLAGLSALKAAYARRGGLLATPPHPQHTLARLVTGEPSAQAHHAARQVLETPGRMYNPLVLFGGPGQGKTHVLEALAHGFREQHPTLQVLLTSAEDLADEWVRSIAESYNHELALALRNVDVLLVDNAHVWGSRTRAQDELVKAMDHLIAQNRQVVLTVDAPPHQLPQVSKSLASRLSAGLVLELASPDFATRLQLVASFADRLGMQVGNEPAVLLARRFRHDTRGLAGALTRLHQRYGGVLEVTRDALEAALLDLSPGDDEPLSLEEVHAVTAAHFGLEPQSLASPKRTPTVKRARQIAMYLGRTLTTASLPEIGRLLDATPNQVLYAERTVRTQLEDPVTARDLAGVRDLLERKPQHRAQSPRPTTARRPRARR